MLDPQGFRDAEAFAALKARLARRLGGDELDALLERVRDLAERRRAAIGDADALRAKLNSRSREVGARKRRGESADDLLRELDALSDQVAGATAAAREADSAFEVALHYLPNPPGDGVPDGGAERNRIVRSWGEPVPAAPWHRPHWELGAALGMLDLPRGAALAGSGFPLLVGAGARLQRALIGFMLDLHTREHGYVEVSPPLVVTRETMTGTGQLPKFEDDLYGVASDGLFLVPTAEVPLTNLHRDEILDTGELPKRYVAYTPCFRREAGAHGKDTRGLIRVHQFDKVELVQLVRPEASDEALETLTREAEEVLRRLALAYRVVELAAGDLGFANARTYDLEVWCPGVGQWLEVSSCSSYGDFQARRLRTRYRPAPGAKPEFVHTLNGSGVALPRTVIALLESYQDADGGVRVPDVLVDAVGTARLGPAGG